tara:strand:+ start:484 stop:720 length:237 start_codon:yes stop_codon:yes gene_type:complete
MEKENISISIQDLALVVNIIDVASKRGAFEGKDLSAVGQVRDNIHAFLVDNAERSQESSEISEDSTPSDPEESPSDTE